MNRSKKVLFIFSAIAWLCVGCGAKRPVLYPNAFFQQEGDQRAQGDVDDCMQKAKAQMGSGSGGEVARKGARGALVGAAAGAAVSAVLGGNVGRSAAAGAAGGGAAGAAGGLFDAADPDPVFKGFVETCLREKGYRVIGWK